jgi:hypothetical protein
VSTPKEPAYKIAMTGYIRYVSIDEAYNIEKQLHANADLLVFVDMCDSRTVLPRVDFHGMWATSPEIRQAFTDWNNEMKDEEKQNKNSWEDS